jgi:uncharacterized membrane protein YjgN (DUF898 family)
VIKNILFTVLTLGIYAAWAKTERRKYLWQNIELHGARLRYHGTGKELFIAYLKAAGLYVGAIAAVGVASAIGPVQQILALVVLGIGVVTLVPFALYGAQRYLLTRTSWRGIRFGLEPEVGGYVAKFFGGWLLTVLTLGLYGPAWQNDLYGYVIDRTRFGTVRFRYSGTNGAAWWLGMKGLLLTVLTLGIYSFWYQAALARFRATHTHIQGARGHLELTGLDMLWLTLVMIALTVPTLGLGLPWATVYAMSYMLERTSLEGEIDAATIEQSSLQDSTATADGIADMLDVGLGI